LTATQAVRTSARRPVGASSEYCGSTAQAGPWSGPATFRSALACVGPVVEPIAAEIAAFFVLETDLLLDGREVGDGLDVVGSALESAGIVDSELVDSALGSGALRGGVLLGSGAADTATPLTVLTTVSVTASWLDAEHPDRTASRAAAPIIDRERPACHRETRRPGHTRGGSATTINA